MIENNTTKEFTDFKLYISKNIFKNNAQILNI